ncbi:hypothetical protein [Actinopolymorpha singaporensis]|nr:hypothetical protein [Actinopolymorpha singaporensis]
MHGNKAIGFALKIPEISSGHYAWESPQPDNWAIVDSQTRDVVTKGDPSVLAVHALGEKLSRVTDHEVLYVGRAWGTEGSRDVFDRLKSHSTLQRIYAEQLSNNFDVFLTFLRIEAATSMVVFGGPESFAAVDRATFLRAYDRTLRPAAVRVEEQVKLAEVMLISHFKPAYNEHHLKDFKDQKNSVTEELRKNGYTNAICIMNSPAGLRFSTGVTDVRRCQVSTSEVPSSGSVRMLVGAAAKSLMEAASKELDLSVDALERGPREIVQIWNAVVPPPSAAMSRLLEDNGIQRAVIRPLLK